MSIEIWYKMLVWVYEYIIYITWFKNWHEPKTYQKHNKLKNSKMTPIHPQANNLTRVFLSQYIGNNKV